MLGHRALGEGPISALLDATLTTTVTRTIRFSTRTFVTRDSDAPTNEVISGRIYEGLRLSRRLSDGPDGQFGSLIETERGEIQLLNADGALDHYVSEYAADGRTLRLMIGATEITTDGVEQVKPYASFEQVYTTTAGEWNFEHDVIRLRIRDLSSRLRNRIQGSVYAGTGSSEGLADLAGRTKPLCFGRCLNVTPQLVDPFILTYQLHSGAIDSVEAVYDAGISDLVLDADYPNYAALAATIVPAGEYATCLAQGFIRLGVAPVGQVTVDLRGDKDNTNGSYVGRHASISRMILRDYGGLTNQELDLDSFTTFNDAQTSEISLFLPSGDTSTVLDVLERIAFSGGAFIGQDRSGLYRIQRLEVPGTTVHWAFDDRSMISIERLSLPYRVPWKAWAVRYAVNWTVQTDTDLAGGVDESRRQFLTNEARYVFANSVDIALFHLTSAGVTRDSLFVSQDNAATEATRLINLYNYGRAIYQVVVKTVLFSVELGQIVRIAYDRWDLAAGKKFIVIGIEDDADNISTTLTVFG